MDLNELKALIRILEESSLSELEIEEEGRRIRLQKPAAGLAYAPIPVASPIPVAIEGAAPRNGGAPALEAEAEAGDGLPTFDAPMVGTFYSAPSPGADPFVKVGDRVEVNQVICIVEAMKLMNEVSAKFPGIIDRVLVENAQPVEFGQPLFAVRPLD